LLFPSKFYDEEFQPLNGVLYKFLSPKEEVIFETCKLVVGISVSDIKMAPIDDQ